MVYFNDVLLSVLLATACLLGGCKSLSFQELRPKTSVDEKLPALKPQVELSSIKNAYLPSKAEATSVGYAAPTFGGGVVSMTKVSGTRFRDARIQDALTLYEREVERNIVVSSEPKYGTIAFQINTIDSKQGALGLAFLSGATLMLPNILGMPFSNHRTALDVEVEIFDSQGSAIASYNAIGEEKIWVRIGGYTAGDAKRVTNIRALRKAFADIKKQIGNDADRIRQRLRESGPIVK